MGREVVLEVIKEKVLKAKNPKSLPIEESLKELSKYTEIDLQKDWWRIPPSAGIDMLVYKIPKETKWDSQPKLNMIKDGKGTLLYYTKTMQMFGVTSPLLVAVSFQRPTNKTKFTYVEIPIKCERQSEGFITTIICDKQGNTLASSSKNLKDLTKAVSVRFTFTELEIPEEFIVITIIPSYFQTSLKIAAEFNTSENIAYYLPGHYMYQTAPAIMPCLIVKVE